MASESVARGVPYLPMAQVDEAQMLCTQAEAVLECLRDAGDKLDSPEFVVPNVIWVVTNHLRRLKEICSLRQEA